MRRHRPFDCQAPSLTLLYKNALSLERSSLVVEVVVNSQYGTVRGQRPFSCDLPGNRPARRIRSDDVFNNHASCTRQPHRLAFPLGSGLRSLRRELGFVTVELVRFVDLQLALLSLYFRVD